MTPLYPTGDAFRQAPRKRLLLFGMSGLGKTHLSAMLRDTGAWFHYSADYRIGTRYLGEAIADEFKAEAMRVPRLAALLRSDSIYVASNLTFENLAPLSGWVGMPGDPARGGLSWDEWRRRQDLHRAAEIAAMEDTAHFAERAAALYGYPHFVCDASGSLCEVTGPGDALLGALAERHLLVWIDGDEGHADTLAARFDRAPKPMYYRPEVVAPIWEEHLARAGGDPSEVDPAGFARDAYARAIRLRRPLYAAMAERGVTVGADEVAQVTDAGALEALVARAIDRRAASG